LFSIFTQVVYSFYYLHLEKKKQQNQRNSQLVTAW